MRCRKRGSPPVGRGSIVFLLIVGLGISVCAPSAFSIGPEQYKKLLTQANAENPWSTDQVREHNQPPMSTWEAIRLSVRVALGHFVVPDNSRQPNGKESNGTTPTVVTSTGGSSRPTEQ